MDRGERYSKIIYGFDYEIKKYVQKPIMQKLKGQQLPNKAMFQTVKAQREI